MIRVAFCDAEIKSQKLFYEAFRECFPDQEEVVFTPYETGRELLEDLRNDLFLQDILLIDPNLPDMDGFVIIEILRRFRMPLTIIVQSRDNEAARKGYRYQVYDFIKKPLRTEEITRVAERYADQFLKSQKQIKTVFVRGREKILNLQKVMYFESHVRVIRAVSEEDEIEFYMKMNELAEELEDKGFMRCHQSFLVNLAYVQRLENSSVILFNRHKIPVSRRYYKQLREKVKIISI